MDNYARHFVTFTFTASLEIVNEEKQLLPEIKSKEFINRIPITSKNKIQVKEIPRGGMSNNIPQDGNYLLWAVTLAFLTAVKDNSDEFKDRLEKLFTSANYDASELENFIENDYNPFDRNAIYLKNSPLDELVSKTLRRNVALYMEGVDLKNGERSEERYQKFKKLIENEITYCSDLSQYTHKGYLNEYASDTSLSGSLPEMHALSEMLDLKIIVHEILDKFSVGNGSHEIELFRYPGNNYDFVVDEKILESYYLLGEIKTNICFRAVMSNTISTSHMWLVDILKHLGV